MSDGIKTAGVHHIGLTVPNVRQTTDFFLEALGFDEVGGNPSYPAIFVSDGAVMVTLWQADAGAAAFDRRAHCGLHHLALKVPDQAMLDRVHTVLAARDDVEIEFAPQLLGDGPARHMMTFIPGGARVEFFAS